MQKYYFLLLTTFILTGCQKYYISIAQERITKESLASTILQTPDPRQKNPPKGEKLIIEWRIPKDYFSHHPSLYLHVIYQDYTEACFVYPMPYPMDYIVYTLQGKEYFDKKGILTYSAEIKVEGQNPFLDWKHQLWTKLITLEEESNSWTKNNNSSVLDHPRQESVRETEGEIEEEKD